MKTYKIKIDWCRDYILRDAISSSMKENWEYVRLWANESPDFAAIFEGNIDYLADILIQILNNNK